MMWFDNLITRWAERIQYRQLASNGIMLEESPKRSRNSKTGISKGTVTRRVEHNYDDRSVISFKVFGANGGVIVETNRYDEKRDTEGINRYVISDDADLAESLGKIVTLEYMR